MLSETQQFLSIIFIMGIGLFILIGSAAMLGYAAAKLGEGIRPPWWLFGLVSVWFGVALAFSMTGLISPGWVAPFALFPIGIGLLLTFIPSIQSLIKEIPTHWLVFLQSYRMAGGIFIFPYMTEGVLTRAFGLEAGIGDVLTGLFAIPVALLIMRQPGRWRWLLYGWTAFGILDLVNAFYVAGTAGFSNPGILPTFPITMIPLFFGPPFGILIHLITVRNYNLRNQTVVEEPKTVPAV